jgi:hypothetical protein
MLVVRIAWAACVNDTSSNVKPGRLLNLASIEEVVCVAVHQRFASIIDAIIVAIIYTVALIMASERWAPQIKARISTDITAVGHIVVVAICTVRIAIAINDVKKV